LGKRDTKTTKELRDKLIAMGISYGGICTDKWDSFLVVFGKDNHIIGKKEYRWY
jgi:IS1 family transposase